MANVESQGRRSIYRGRVVDLSVERVRFPGGHEVDLELIHHPGAAAVVPLAADGTVLLVRQYRHATGGWLLEVPPGNNGRGSGVMLTSLRGLTQGVQPAGPRAFSDQPRLMRLPLDRQAAPSCRPRGRW